MKWLRTALLILVFLFTENGGSWAQERLLPSLKRIVDRGEITVALISDNAPPMIMTDDKNRLTGFDISLARFIGKLLGVKVAFRRMPSFDDVVDVVARLEADIGLSFLTRTPERARVVLFTRPYVSQSASVLINRVRGLRFRNSCPSAEEAGKIAESPKQLGLLLGSAYEQVLKARFPNAKPVTFDAFDKMFKSVLSGEIMLSLQGEIGARYFMDQNPYAYIKLMLCKIGRRKDHIGIAVRPDSHDLAAWLDVLLDSYGIRLEAEELKDGNFELLFR